MSAVNAQVLRRTGVVAGGLAFVLQVIVAISIEAGDDLGRAIFAQHGTRVGILHARGVVGFEAAHGFFVEPAWQIFFLHTRHIFALTVTWLAMARLFNGIYVLGHIVFTLGVALWVYVYRRRWFGMMRNVVILVNLFALAIYENFPVAPPRLTDGLIFNHHAFTFRDTLFGITDASGRVVGTQVGYNEFSAMPSVHMAWAIIAGAALVFLARSWWAKALGLIYPVCMLVAVVVTGNHYLLDVAGSIVVVLSAYGAARLLDRWWNAPERGSPFTPGVGGAAPYR